MSCVVRGHLVSFERLGVPPGHSPRHPLARFARCLGLQLDDITFDKRTEEDRYKIIINYPSYGFLHVRRPERGGLGAIPQ
jgi:hypothetical protein